MDLEPLLAGLRQQGLGWIALRADSVPESAPLSGPEQARAARFRNETDRTAFVKGRYLIRSALSARMQLDQIPIDIDVLGKPFCPLAGAPHFNLSHAAGWLALAMRLEGPVGIDIEDTRREVDQEKLAARWFSDAERRAVAEGGAEIFFDIWTRKEAWLKAAGTGIRVRLNQLDTFAAPGIRFTPFRVADWIAGCIAVE
jgi:4'-phosphopantetheinyl transferase